MEALYVIGVIIAIVIEWSIAKEFASIAADKGYSESRYFWFCFLLSIIGYLMVASLPDRGHANVPTSPATPAPQAAAPQATPTTPTTPTYNGKTGGATTAILGLYQNKCTKCDKWQPKNNTFCEQCGARFTAFVEKE